MIMRADGVHRVILNSPIFKEMKFGDLDGGEPMGRVMHLQAMEDGKPTALQIRVSMHETRRLDEWSADNG